MAKLTKMHLRGFRITMTKCTNFIKTDSFNFELYCFKVGAFFETQCIYVFYLQQATFASYWQSNTGLIFYE